MKTSKPGAPQVYKITTEGGRNNYTGIAKRGRVQDRIVEHLSGSKDPIPGTKVQIEQMSGIQDARAPFSKDHLALYLKLKN